MNEIQVDFINTIKRYYPFLPEYDQLTEALTYVLNMCEEDEDGDWYTTIDGKEFLSMRNGALWNGKRLT